MMHASKERSISGQGGFTLLEVIVAVTLVAVMAVGLWAIFRITIRSWSRGTEFMDANQRHRSILNLVRKQLASTYGLLAPPSQQTGTVPPGAYVAGMGSLVFNGTEDSLQFISLNSLQFQESPGLTLVSYEVSQDSGENYALVEKEARYLGQMPEEESSLNNSKAIPIFENLSSCLFEYFDPGDAANPSQWVREWDGQKLRRLPLAVSMTMISRDPSGNAMSRHLVVPIKAEPFGQGIGPINPFGVRGVVQ
jgi:prepilin-type N-terminal cleavage/methylation domain-containing protein